MIFPSFVVLFIDADIIVSFNSNFLSFYWTMLWDWAVLLDNVSSPKSDIISLEAVVEGHPFPVTFKYTLHKRWNNLTSRWWIHDSIYTEMHADPY